MSDLRKFWLGTIVYLLITGAVMAAVGKAFYAFVGMPSKVVQQPVTQPAPSQAADGKGVTTQIEREAAAPAALPLPPPVRPPPPSDTAAAMPELFVPAPLIVPERRSTRRRGQVF